MIETRPALVFDYDGVIADTEPLHWRSWAALLLRHGIQFGWAEYGRVGQGVGDAQIYEHFCTRMPEMDASALSIQIAERKRMVREWSLEKSPIAQETVALLQSLDGYRIGLVTSSDRSEVEPALCVAGIYKRFDAMVFGGEASAPKPSPAPYQLIAKRLGVKTGIAFEDSEPGLASAKAAGFQAVKVSEPGDLAEIVRRTLR